MTDSYAYLHLALSSETPSRVRENLPCINWKRLSSQACQYFLSIAVTQTVLSVAQTAHAALRLGDVGFQVTQVQRELQARGYFNANVTGFYGPITQDAVIRFQADNGLQQDGVVGPQTLAALNFGSVPPTPTPIPDRNRDLIGLGVGDRGPGVTDLQTRLRRLGYFSTNPTGFFGQITRDAVVRFQVNNGLPGTGLVTADTLAFLNSSLTTPIVGSNSGVFPVQPIQRVLKQGDFGTDVGLVQQNLQQRGYYLGSINNFFDGATEQAVVRFQRDNRITTTGQVGPTTLGFLSVNLSVGAATQPLPRPVPARPVPLPAAVRPINPIFPGGSTDSSVLGLGSRGQAVVVLQQRLSVLGYHRGPIDGVFGLSTRRAVIDFQRAFGITQTGLVGLTTQTYLVQAVPQFPGTSRNVLGFGSRGADVRDLQQRLRAANFYFGPITGYYDRSTQLAVIRFQQTNGVTATGQVGPTTRSFLAGLQTNVPRRVVAANPASTSNRTVGRASDRVRRLQEILEAQGLYNGPINGIYTAETQSAVARARSVYGTSADTILFGGL
ncbi:MAG: peptidoglycan-binding protein [Microcoleaceae cyanobacterium]